MNRKDTVESNDIDKPAVSIRQIQALKHALERESLFTKLDGRNTFDKILFYDDVITLINEYSEHLDQ